MLEEARGLWQSVIVAEEDASALDRAASWAGLCRYAFERGARDRAAGSRLPRMATRWIWPTGAGPRLLHAAYFHCQQADRFYTALLDTRWEDVRLRTARASVLASIGLLLEQHGPPGIRHDVDGWQCSADAVVPATLLPGARVTRSVLVGRFTRPALRYYRRALSLLPDDTVLRCREATATLALDPDLPGRPAHAGPAERLGGAPRPGRFLLRSGAPVSRPRAVRGAHPVRPGPEPPRNRSRGRSRRPSSSSPSRNTGRR